MGLSSGGEAAALAALLTGASISLHTGDPGNTGANEVTGGAYARQTATFANSGSNPTTASNNAVIQFPVATAAWGTISYFGVWVGGVFFAGAALTTAKAVGIDDVMRFIVGAITVTAD